MYHEMFRQMTKQLGQLDHCLEAAAAYAKERSFDPNLFVGFRLAPDQFAFARQIQIACDTPKYFRHSASKPSTSGPPKKLGRGLP